MISWLQHKSLSATNLDTPSDLTKLNTPNMNDTQKTHQQAQQSDEVLAWRILRNALATMHPDEFANERLRSEKDCAIAAVTRLANERRQYKEMLENLQAETSFSTLTPSETETAQVREFMVEAGQELPTRPTMPSLKIRMLRARLMLEEVLETIHLGLGLAVMDFQKSEFSEAGPGNLIELADGCADTKVVTIGTELACGINGVPVFAEVHRSNMSKFIDGHRREDGKWIKGPSYSPANVKEVLIGQGWTP